jgi:hypothetical protein
MSTVSTLGTALSYTKPRYMDLIVRKAIHIELPGRMASVCHGILSHVTADLGSLRGHASPCTLPISGHKYCPLRELTRLQPDVQASFRSLISIPPPASDSFTLPLSVTCRFPVHHTFTICPHLFPRPAKPSICRTILSSRFCFLLFRSVVVWDSNGFIPSHGEPMRTEIHCSISPLLLAQSEIFGQLTICFHTDILLGLFDAEYGGHMFLRNVGWL